MVLWIEYHESESELAARNRSNLLTLAVLLSLYERPMHPYEIATTLRRRGKDESVRLNYGSLYSVVGSLERRGLIAELETGREGRLPVRTVYRITDAGRIEAHDWLAELVSTPIHEYPAFIAALSFLPALAPDEALTLLSDRATALELALAQARGARELLESRDFPRLFWVEAEFASALAEAELAYVRRLMRDIVENRLGGIEWWRALHDPDVPHPPPPPVGDDLAWLFAQERD
jgi:DNA-binding PadR family transcriptional regulator